MKIIYNYYIHLFSFKLYLSFVFFILYIIYIIFRIIFMLHNAVLYMNFTRIDKVSFTRILTCFFICLKELWNTDKEYHTLPSLNARCLWSNVEQEKDEEKNVKIVRDTRNLSWGADVRWAEIYRFPESWWCSCLIDFSALTFASF